MSSYNDVHIKNGKTVSGNFICGVLQALNKKVKRDGQVRY
jgi:hypothetical protein